MLSGAAGGLWVRPAPVGAGKGQVQQGLAVGLVVGVQEALGLCPVEVFRLVCSPVTLFFR